MIYRLSGKFAIFHWFSVLSCLTLTGGIYPILTKKSKNYILFHFNPTYWSVVGLYCAFCAEICTRIPLMLNLPNTRGLFGALTGVRILIVMVIAIFI